jgi:hypothetical protein
MITFYNQSGRAVAYLDDDDESIYLYGSNPVAWLSGESIYSCSGRYLGWFEDGWVLDRSGIGFSLPKVPPVDLRAPRVPLGLHEVHVELVRPAERER